MTIEHLPPDEPAHGPLFRAYLRWAEPQYARIAARYSPDTAAWARRTDQWLYTTRTGQLFCAMLLLALAGLVVLMSRTGMPWVAALVAGGILLWALVSVTVAPWMRPEAFEARRMLRISGRALLLGVFGCLFGIVIETVRHPEGELLAQVVHGLLKVLPLIVAVVAVLLLTQWGVASLRRHLLAQEVERLQLIHQRDQAALRTQQAELRLLQAQIQPHFIFNTLAALQHWVDSGDRRAGPLLRQLTGFLRAGTELMGRDQGPLGDELHMAARYLEIMRQRLGERLDWRDEVPPALRDELLPAGLLMTLVENAVEHAVEPSLRPVAVVLGGARDGRRAWLWVDDGGPGVLTGEAAPDGVGLANVRNRLRHAYGDAAHLALQPRAEGGCRALISWPCSGAPAGQSPDDLEEAA